MGYTSYDDIILEITTNGKIYDPAGFKLITSPEASGVWHSCWREAGMPGAGADPATTPGTAYTDVAGGLFFPNQASDTKHLLAAFLNLSANGGAVMIYDRLVAVSGISLATTGNKTISSAALPRYTSGVGVECWLEFTTASTATIGSVTLNSYTDEDGNTGQTGAAQAMPAAATNVNTFVPLPLAAGDKGLRAVSTINVGTATTGGVVNVVLLKRLATLDVPINIGTLVDFVTGIPILPRIYDGATLAFAAQNNGTTNARLDFQLHVGYG